MSAVTVKKLSESQLKKLNEKASKNKLSQQEYLRRLIEKDIMAPEVDETIKRHEELIKACLVVLNENTEVMKKLLKVYGEG